MSHFLKDQTTIDEDFKTIIKNAQNKHTLSLVNHYKLLQRKLKEETNELETKIQQALTNTKSREVRDTHYRTVVVVISWETG